jgi:6-pyruvoyltetrahydropterin/6-carboxytetrahydropterin synthase
MYVIGKSFRFDAAHELKGLSAGHKCGRLHGHTYTVEVQLSAESLVEPGFVTDFADLAPVKDCLDSVFDHRFLNEVLEVAPTSELIAEHLFDWCSRRLTLPAGVAIHAVRVSETPSTWAEYRRSP